MNDDLSGVWKGKESSGGEGVHSEGGAYPPLVPRFEGATLGTMQRP